MNDHRSLAVDLLQRWGGWAQGHWYNPGVRDEAGHALGCFGTGYNAWGVQTNQKYLAAAAVVGTSGREGQRGEFLQRALAALRFSLFSHHCGRGSCTDNTQWGHTWISALGIERMMFAVAALGPHLDDADRAALQRVLCSEATWLLEQHRRGSHEGVFADRWNASGKNAPESNLWNGALLWRAAAMYPNEPQAQAWRERAVRFLINTVSVAADADDQRVVDGKPVRNWWVGANFFPHFALDHHGYLNVGYMVICLSNAAMLHFDLKQAGLPRPASLDHHQGELWQVVRRMIFADGRLARIGGDSRVRYAYCQEYLLPALLYAADHLGEEHALGLAQRQIEMIAREAADAGDGSFYGRRLAPLARANPYYYTRLESDRACALAMYLTYRPLVAQTAGAAASGFEASVAGAWSEPEHGAILERSPSRLASFAWRAHGLTQGLMLPPDAGDLAEWEHNLVSVVEFLQHTPKAQPRPGRRLLRHQQHSFPGGFLTFGAVMEGAQCTLAEGWSGTDLAEHQIVFAALPDGHSVLGLEFCRTAALRTWLARVLGLHMQIPNDLYNGFVRRIESAGGLLELTRPVQAEQVIALTGRWLTVDQRLAVISLQEQPGLAIHRSPRPADALAGIDLERICIGCSTQVTALPPATTVLDLGWMVCASVAAEQARALAEQAGVVEAATPLMRQVTVQAVDGQRYQLAANFGGETANVPPPAGAVDLATGQAAQALMAAGAARLLRLPG